MVKMVALRWIIRGKTDIKFKVYFNHSKTVKFNQKSNGKLLSLCINIHKFIGKDKYQPKYNFNRGK